MSIKCKVYNGRLYCYDKDTKEVKVFLQQNFGIDECPKCIIESFFDGDFDAEISFKDND